jgi:tetratricopeptide (TPR) repeat protein
MPEWGVRFAAVLVGLFLVSSTVAFLRGVSGGMEFVNLALTDPMSALRQLGPGQKSASQEALDAQAAEIAKIKMALVQLQSAQGAALTNDSEARRDGAVKALATDDSAAGQEAAAKLAAGDLKGAAELLERAAQAQTQGAAENWRRIGALFIGADNTRAERAYAAAYALDPNDYTAALELSRLNRIALRPQDAARFASQALTLSQNPRSQFAALTALGQAQTAQGLLEESLATKRQALAQAEALAKDNPNNQEDMRNLSIAHFQVGLTEMDQGVADWGKAQFERSYKITADLALAQKGNVNAPIDMTYPAIRLGDIALKNDQLKDAATWFERSLRILEKAAKAQPENIEVQRSFAIAYQKLGNTMMRAQAGDLALRDYSSALSVMEALQAKSPNHKGLQRDLAVARNKVADALAATKKHIQARAMYEKALPMFVALAAEAGASPVVRRDVAVTYEKIGDTAIAESQYAEALKWYEKSLPVSQALARDFPSNAQFDTEAKMTAVRVQELKGKLDR